MLRFVASILLALSAGTAAAANIDPRLAKFDVCGRFEIFHINGIQTTKTEANDNRVEVRSGPADLARICPHCARR